MNHQTSQATTAFLEGQGIAVEPREIEAELEALWGPAAEQAGGPDLDHPAVTKVVLANVILSRITDGASALETVLEHVAARFPSRTIVLTSDRHEDRRVRAEVSALCHLPAPGLPQVCSERIVLRAGPNALDLLPGTIRPLLESDLPCILWWSDDPRTTADLFAELAPEATRILLDRPDPSADPTFLHVCVSHPKARDSAWYAATPWRELIAQCFDPADTRPALRRLRSVAIRAAAQDRTCPPRLAMWLLGWLAGQLGWQPSAGTRTGDGGLDATFAGPVGDITVSLRVDHDPHAASARLLEVFLTTHENDGDGTFHLMRCVDAPDEVRIEVCSPTHCNLPRRVHAPEFDPVRKVASAFESRPDDPPYRNALPIVLWLCGLCAP